MAACGREPASPAPDASLRSIALPFSNGDRPLVQLPGKRAMIQLTARPPQLQSAA